MSSVTARRSSSVERANIQTPFTYTTTGIRFAQSELMLMLVGVWISFCSADGPMAVAQAAAEVETKEL